jgi:hypothetical protein
MMISNPGNEKMVEKASDELNLRISSSIKSETDLLSILHNLFGAIKGKMVISIAYIHNAKRSWKVEPKASLREKLKVEKDFVASFKSLIWLLLRRTLVLLGILLNILNHYHSCPIAHESEALN